MNGGLEMKKTIEVEVLNWPWSSPVECVKITKASKAILKSQYGEGFCYGLPLSVLGFKIPTTTNRKKARRFRITVEAI